MPLRVFCWSKFFCRGYLVCPKFFFLGISWVWNFFSWEFCGYKHFSGGYFMGTNFFLVGVSWVQNFFSWVFRGSNFLVANFVIYRFSVVPCMRKSDRKKKYINSFKPCILFQIDFYNYQFCLKGILSTKLVMLLRSFHLYWLHFSHLISSVLGFLHS